MPGGPGVQALAGGRVSRLEGVPHWHFQIIAGGQPTAKVCINSLQEGLAIANRTEDVFQIYALAQARPVGGLNCQACRRVEVPREPA